MRTPANIVLVILLSTTACNDARDGDRIFFGDLHAHSTLSAPDRVGDATPTDFFRVARDDVHLDFAALSDHDAFLTFDEWAEVRRTAPLFDEPGRFVAFSALEWTHRWHMNVAYREDDVSLCDCPESPEFYDAHEGLIRENRAAAHLNHPAGIFLPDWSMIDDRVSRNVEVFNASAGDQENGFSGAIWSLRAGFRFGFVGVSDDHMTDAIPPLIGRGITGCHAESLTRDSILAALNERRCYATTGARIALDLEVDGVPMGGHADVEIGSSVTARVTVTATAPPAEVEFVLNGHATDGGRCEAGDCEFTAELPIRDPSNFIYARIVQSDGERAWSSPVWFHGHCKDSGATCLDGRLLPGGGPDVPSDCLTDILLPEGAAPVTLETDTPTIRCRRGDPTCDSGAQVDACAIRVGLCFEVDDPRQTECRTAPADAFEVIEPGPDAEFRTDDWINRQTLLATFRALHTGDTGMRCSGVGELIVPLGERRTFHLRTRAGDRIDEDRLTAECIVGS